MAEGKIYLRPSADVSLGHPVYPSSLSAGYLAISEEVADGKSTYIGEAANTSGAAFDYTSVFKMAQTDEKNITRVSSAKFFISLDIGTSSSAANIGQLNRCEMELYVSGQNISSGCAYRDTPASDQQTGEIRYVWNGKKLYHNEMPWDIPNFADVVNSHLSTYGSLPEITIKLRNSSISYSNTKANTLSYITAVHIELECEYSAGLNIHRKVEGTWKQAKASYQKINGAWAEISEELLKSILAASLATKGATIKPPDNEDWVPDEGDKIRYVSLGDSIAAGHTINANWERDYGIKSQYGENNNTETFIVPGCYTDLIRTELAQRTGEKVAAISFAHSGDMVSGLISKLDHDAVRREITDANLVTICIGANNVLQPALNNLESYINYGTPALGEISALVEAQLDRLNDDTDPNSFKALLNKLHAINPNAIYVFTSIYNPLKYLWIEESTEAQDYKDGFFGPLMWAIPDLGSISNYVRGLLYDAAIVQRVFDRINGPSRNGSDSLAAWTENYVSRLNEIMATKIAFFSGSNFKLAESKQLFDSFPDRPVQGASIHYNDLVNIEFTRGYVIEDLDWGKFWNNVSWGDITNSYEATMANVMRDIVSNVIMPDIDPHPEEYGHVALQRAFDDALGWRALDRYRITFAANGGSGSMAAQEVIGMDGMAAYASIRGNGFGLPFEGAWFTGWNTAADGSGTSYSAGQVIGITGDLTLYAQWSGVYIVRVRHSYDSILPGDSSSSTGPMEYYAIWENGVEQSWSNLGAFSNPAVVLTRAYGHQMGIIVGAKAGDKNRPYIDLKYKDGHVEDISQPGSGVTEGQKVGTITITAHTDIHFIWHHWYDGVNEQSYWTCEITLY